MALRSVSSLCVLAAGLTAISIVLSGCGAARISELGTGGDLTPAPTRARKPERLVSIRLSGNVADAAPPSITVEDLEKLPQTEYDVRDPYAHKKVRYKGVLVRDVVARYGKPDTTRLRLRALDEFKAEITRDEWTKWTVLLATRKNGERMTIADSGPARIVFPYDTAKDIDPIVYNDKWIWQVNRISFEKQ